MPFRGRAPDLDVPGTRPVPAQLGLTDISAVNIRLVTRGEQRRRGVEFPGATDVFYLYVLHIS